MLFFFSAFLIPLTQLSTFPVEVCVKGVKCVSYLWAMSQRLPLAPNATYTFLKTLQQQLLAHLQLPLHSHHSSLVCDPALGSQNPHAVGPLAQGAALFCILSCREQ